MNPTGSCGGVVLGSEAIAATLTLINPTVQPTLEYAVFITSPHRSFTASGDDLRRPCESYFRPIFGQTMSASSGK
jgi:hypothetical protein